MRAWDAVVHDEEEVGEVGRFHFDDRRIGSEGGKEEREAGREGSAVGGGTVKKKSREF